MNTFSTTTSTSAAKHSPAKKEPFRNSRANTCHYVQLRFPSASESNCFGSIVTSSLPPTVNAIPDTFQSVDEYAGALVRALVGQVQYALDDFATKFGKVLLRLV